jgi:hypothetical protein
MRNNTSAGSQRDKQLRTNSSEQYQPAAENILSHESAQMYFLLSSFQNWLVKPGKGGT